MTMKPLLLRVGIVVFLGLGATWLYAAPTIGLVSVTPPTVAVNTPTTITVTVAIPDPLLLPQSVNLIRIAGVTSTVVGILHDDGLSGDAVAGDHVFTTLVQLDESYPGPVTLQVSAAFTGLLRRVISPPVVVTAQGLLLPTVLSTTTYIARGIVTSLNSYSSGLYIFTDLTVTILSTIKGSPLPNDIVVRTLGGAVGTFSQLPPYGTPFAVGQQVVLFLDGPDTANKYAIPSGSLGIFRLQQDATGRTIAVVDSGYNTMEMSVALDSSYKTFLLQSTNFTLSLDDLIAAISAH
jgi:hypothetical protein